MNSFEAKESPAHKSHKENVVSERDYKRVELTDRHWREVALIFFGDKYTEEDYRDFMRQCEQNKKIMLRAWYAAESITNLPRNEFESKEEWILQVFARLIKEELNN